MSVLLETRGLSVSIAGKTVCRGLDLVIAAGQRWALLGPNGAGKTTLLHTLTGLRPAEGGAILIKGQPLATWKPKELARVLGTLLQNQDDPFPSTVLETVMIGRHPHLGRWQWEGEADYRQATAALAAVDLAGFETRLIGTLSGGERRRVALAAVLCQNPALFALDEPTNHLDLHHQTAVMALFAAQTRQAARALVMVLHDLTAAARYCDHVLLIYGNGATRAGAAAELLNEENLQGLYGHRLHRLRGPDGDAWVPAMPP